MNTGAFRGFGSTRLFPEMSTAALDKHLAKNKVGFVGSILFHSNDVPKEICIIYTPTFDRYFFGIDVVSMDDEPSFDKEEIKKIQQDLLDFYIQSDLMRGSKINVQSEREKTWLSKLGLPTSILTGPEMIRLNTIPSPYQREIPMDMGRHVGHFHRDVDEECAVRNAYDLQGKYFSVLRNNIVFNTKVENYSDVDWMEDSMWGGGLPSNQRVREHVTRDELNF